MSLYDQSVPNFSRMLDNLKKWLDKAEEHAAAKKFDTQVLINARLAPDQLSFVRQVQIACDAAKNGSARLAGVQAPSHADTEQTFADVRARIEACQSYLGTLSAKNFEGAEARVIPLPNAPGKALAAPLYLSEYAFPNFYFHLVTAYAILRHNGVDLGKKDYLGRLSLQDA